MVMLNLNIENLSLAHVDDVMEIEENAYGKHHWPRESFVNEVKNDVAHYLCATIEGRVAGYIGVWEIIDEAHITTIAVHPNYKGKGIAKALLIAALERCYEVKIKYITLEVRASNQAAIGLYEKFGFKSLGVRKKYYQNDGEDALIMWTQNIFDKNYKEMFEKNKREFEK